MLRIADSKFPIELNLPFKALHLRTNDWHSSTYCLVCSSIFCSLFRSFWSLKSLIIPCIMVLTAVDLTTVWHVGHFLKSPMQVLQHECPQGIPVIGVCLGPVICFSQRGHKWLAIPDSSSSLTLHWPCLCSIEGCNVALSLSATVSASALSISQTQESSILNYH